MSEEIIINIFDDPVQSVNGQIGSVVLTKTDVGLSAVDNTSDLNKPLSLASLSAFGNINSSVVPNSGNWNQAYTNLVTNSGFYLSGVDLTFLSVSGNWNSVYNNVNSLSSNWFSASAESIKYTHANFLPLTGGILSGSVRFNSDVTIFGNLTSSGTQTFANTIFSTTSSLSVVHVGSGPALYVGNNGNGNIASFYDIDQNVEILHVGGINSNYPNVGINTSTPNKTFTINGEVSANNTIYDNVGNSTQWNSVYNNVNSTSSNNLLVYNNVNLLSGNWNSVYNLTNNISSNIILAGGNTRNANITIGTNNAFHLAFETNNNTKMTILSSGEVGIGTTITETASAGNGGLIVKNNLLVGGTTIKETANLTQPSIVNGNFQNITGLTASLGWFTGVPFGWTSPNVSPTFAVWNGSGDYVANLGTLANTSGGSNSFRQNLGTLQVMSDVSVTFDYANVTIAPWRSGTLNAAIYDGNFNILATSTHSVQGTYSLTAPNVPVGTTIIVGFWCSSGNPALNNVTVTIADNTVLTVVGGLSASSMVMPKLQVQNGVVIFSNLPTSSANLPVGAVWNNNGALRIV